MIEEKKWTFALTGSSARKLKRGSANLLAGRAFSLALFPLTHRELGQKFQLDQILLWASLPKLLELKSDADRTRYLRSYVLNYIKEEIVAEQITRKLEPLRHFLEVSAQMNEKIVNYASIARDVGVDTKSVQSYFQILEDTLMGFQLPAYHASIRKSQRQAPKFYWFDLGVRRCLENTLDLPAKPSTAYYGELFEHWIILEAARLNQYSETHFQLYYYQTYSGTEVDLILTRVRNFTKRAHNLARMKDSFPESQLYLLSQDPTAKKIGEVHCLHWIDGLNQLFPKLNEKGKPSRLLSR